jgi:hypothetical protein
MLCQKVLNNISGNMIDEYRREEREKKKTSRRRIGHPQMGTQKEQKGETKSKAGENQ